MSQAPTDKRDLLYTHMQTWTYPRHEGEKLEKCTLKVKGRAEEVFGGLGFVSVCPPAHAGDQNQALHVPGKHCPAGTDSP